MEYHNNSAWKNTDGGSAESMVEGLLHLLRPEGRHLRGG